MQGVLVLHAVRNIGAARCKEYWCCTLEGILILVPHAVRSIGAARYKEYWRRTL